MINKTIAIVPPNAVLKRQDFALGRICGYLQKKGIKVVLVQLVSSPSDFVQCDALVEFKTKKEIIEFLQKSNFDLVVHRSWMHAYGFAADLAENISKIVFYIKDWMVEISKEEYAFQYKTSEDYDAIERLFGSGKTILSHYNEDYTKNIWAKNYQVEAKRFVYFPEFTDSINYHDKAEVVYDVNSVRLLAVGRLSPTSFPCEIADGKTFLKNVQMVTKQKIRIDKMVLKDTYELVFNSGMFQDYIYEHNFNDYFNIVLGGELNTSQTQEYHFGVYQHLFYEAGTKESQSMLNADVSKFAYYLEAGLPIVANEQFSIAKTIKENKIGIVVSNSQMKDIKAVLDISQKEYEELVMNVKSFRKKFSYRDETMKPILEMLQ